MSSTTPWVPPKAPLLTSYGQKGAHNIGPPGSQMSVTLCHEMSTWCSEMSTRCPEMSNWCSTNCCLVFWQQTRQQFLGYKVDFSGHRVHFSGHQVELLGQDLAGFQGTSWQTFGTHGAQYYDPLYACSRAMGGYWEATKVLLNLFKRGPSTKKNVV